MPFVRTALLAAAASLLAATAFAQTDAGAMPPSDQSATLPPASDPAPAVTDSSAMPPPADAAPIGAAADTSATVDANGVVWHSAQPIPDTRANRAADGQPLSHAGKVSPPIGN
jgi:hypothetical protein